MHSSNNPGGELATAQDFLTKQLPTVLNKHTAFHTAQLSNCSGYFWAWVQMTHLFSLLQVLPSTPISLVQASPVSVVVYRLCVSYFISIFPRDFQHPGPSLCWAALPALVGEGAGGLTLLSVSCIRCQTRGHSNLCPCAAPREPTVPAQPPQHLVFNVLYNIWPPNFI